MKGYSGPDAPRYEDYIKCVHCGLCLNTCPTYRELGVEMDSPRGRIYQMILVDQGRLELGESFVRHIDLCLDCRACETACPSGVEYGKLVEAARAQIERNYRRSLAQRLGRRLLFHHVLPSPLAMRVLGRLLWFYQASGLRALARGSGLLRAVGVAGVEALAPEAEPPFFFSQIGRVFPAQGKRRYRVAFFAGCLANVTHARMNEATVKVLRANGCEVVVPAGQTCCGALHVHAGVRDLARDLARQNLDVFLREPFDAILTNAAGCGSTLKEYAHLLEGEGGTGLQPVPRDRISPTGKAAQAESLCHRAREFVAKMKDVTEFLAEVGLAQPLGPVRAVATYQDPCHLGHGQRVRAAPRQLIRAVPELEFREIPRAEICCGSAGIYNVLHTDLALQLLQKKMEDAQSTGATLILTSNPGCLLQLRAGARLYSTGQRVLHVMELLEESARAAVGSGP